MNTSDLFGLSLTLSLLFILGILINGMHHEKQEALEAYATNGTYSYRTGTEPVIGDTAELLATKEQFKVVSTYSVRDAGLLVVLKSGDNTLTVSIKDIRKVKVVE